MLKLKAHHSTTRHAQAIKIPCRVFRLKVLACYALLALIFGNAAAAEINIPKNGRYIVNRHLISDSGISRSYEHIVQDGRGLIYAAGQIGIFQYDGVSWRNVPGSDFLSVSVLAADQNDRVYVGGLSDFGYVDINHQGQAYYRSIAKGLLEDDQFSEFIRSLHILNDEIVFVGDQAIYIWNEVKGISVIKAGSHDFFESFTVDGQVLVQKRGVGIFRLEHGALQPFLLGRFFEDRKLIMMMKSLKNGLLIVTYRHGLFFYDGQAFKPFKTEADHLIEKKYIEHATQLPSGRIALGLGENQYELILIDEAGKLVEHIAARHGLPEYEINHVEQDYEGNLWLASAKGVAHIELSSVRYFDEKHGLKDYIYSMNIIDNDIYLATRLGVMKLEREKSTSNVVFNRVTPKNLGCFNIVETPIDPITACHGKIYSMGEPRQVVYQSPHKSFNWLVPVNEYAEKIIVCHNKGLGLLELKNNQWGYKELFPEQINMKIYNLIREHEHSYWFHNGVSGVVNLLFIKGLDRPPVIKSFNQTHGLPGGYIEITAVNGKPLFSTQQGLYEYDRHEKNTQRLFKPSRFIPKEFKGRKAIVGQESNGQIWMLLYKDLTKPPSNNNRFQIFLANQNEGLSYEWGELLIAVPDLLKNSWVELRLANHLWLSSSNRLYQVDLNTKRFSKNLVKPLLRQIKNAKDGKTLYGGSGDIKMLDLAYEKGSLIFDYAYPYFSIKERNSYQYQLQGYSDQWSEWSSDTRKEYTDLREGRYQFKIRAKNAYGEITESDGFTFVINPPWYRTWYAYFVYAALCLAFLYLMIKFYTKTLRKRADYLEGVVKQRTERIESLLSAKNTLFSNVSHEFRTPLTLIQGPVNELIEQTENKKQQSLLKMVRRNTQRLLNMVEQLLDVARIESPNEQAYKLYELSSIIRLQLDALQSLIKEKQLTFQVELAGSAYILAMADALETMTINLLTNAIKYTPAGGSVRVKLDNDNGRARLSVKDNGIGIAEQDHDSIFDRFVRIDNNRNRHIQGTGIGLALVKELAQLHGGGISVFSTLGQGAEFVLSLPIADQHQAANVEKTLSQPSQVNAPVSLVSSAEQGQHENNREKTGNSKPQLLIIEDTDDMRDYLYSILQAKYDCLLANDGETGMRLAKTNLPDLIISDVMMLGMDGFQVLQAIRETPLTSHIPLILLTAKGDDESRLKGLRQLADDYIAKPFEKKLLLTRIENLLSVRRLVRDALLQQFQQEEYPQAQYQKVLGEQKQCFVKQFHQLVENNFHDERYSVEKMASSLSVSVRQLQKKLKSELDKGPKEYLVAFRLKLAAKYLRESELSVSEISARVGFSSPSHFANTFKAHYAISASEYRHHAVTP